MFTLGRGQEKNISDQTMDKHCRLFPHFTLPQDFLQDFTLGGGELKDFGRGGGSSLGARGKK